MRKGFSDEEKEKERLYLKSIVFELWAVENNCLNAKLWTGFWIERRIKMGNKKQNRLERTRRTPFKGNRHTSSLKDGVSSQAQEKVIPSDEANAIELDSSPAISASAKKLRGGGGGGVNSDQF